MFNSPWLADKKQRTVWAQTSFGMMRIADCASKTLTIKSQRLNARLISQAPEMWDCIALVLIRHGDALDPDLFKQMMSIRDFVQIDVEVEKGKPVGGSSDLGAG